MTYRVYHKDTTRYLCFHPGTQTKREYFLSVGAAKAAITREAKRGAIVASDFLIAESTEFHNNIEKTHEVKNPMSGKMVTERVNTPWAASVASDAYWQS